MEDDRLVRQVVSDLLAGAGFAVLTTGSGAEALAALEAEGRRLSALVTDVDLGPGPNGWDVAVRARELDPALPVIYVTESGRKVWDVLGVPESALIDKPLAPAELLAALEARLGGGR